MAAPANTELHPDQYEITHPHEPAGEPAGEDFTSPIAPEQPVNAEEPTFVELGVREEITAALHKAGIERTFAIQSLTLPLALQGDDVIGQARTGMGKTLGFGVPLLQRLAEAADQHGSDQDGLDGTPHALVVVPTRELCLQVSRDLTEAGSKLGVRVQSIYGGRPYEEQISGLRSGVDLVVGTPGRLLDLAEQRHLVLSKVRMLVLDEADEMLDLGFLPDIERIMRMLPEHKQTMLFSATMPGPILTLARTFLKRPTHVRAEATDSLPTHERTRQFAYRAHALDKVELLARALQAESRELTMIFTRTKRTAQKVADDLDERGFATAAVHGDLGQGAREQALRAFRSGKVDVLVATDVAARGIDVEDVTHVVNYQCPEDEKNYVHRIGRTGRAGRTGVAITLVDWDEETRWKMISDALELDIPEPVETYSTSAHLFTDLGVPTDARGRLPLAKRTRSGLGSERSEALDSGERKRTARSRSRGTGGSRSQGGQFQGAGSDTPASSDGSGHGSQSSGHSRTRRRRRTRGGEPVSAAATETSAGNGTGAAADSGSGEQAGGASRRRRRRRGGARSNGSESSQENGRQQAHQQQSHQQ